MSCRVCYWQVVKDCCLRHEAAPVYDQLNVMWCVLLASCQGLLSMAQGRACMKLAEYHVVCVTCRLLRTAVYGTRLRLYETSCAVQDVLRADFTQVYV